MKIRSFERKEYTASLEEMRRFSASRSTTTEDEIWLVEHEQVFTLGLASKPEHLLSAGNIPCVQTERGGQITFHGPGQVLAYLLLDLRRSSIMVRELVCIMESAIIETLAAYRVKGVRKGGAPGVYVEIPTSPVSGSKTEGSICSHTRQAKIAALGLKVSKGCTYHGLALNVDMDLKPFTQINPCGFPGLEVTDIKHYRALIRSGHILGDSDLMTSKHKHSYGQTTLDPNAALTNELRLFDVAKTLGATLHRHLTNPR